MVFLVALIVLTFALALLNLLLTYGIIRRLNLSHPALADVKPLLPDEDIGDFETATTRGKSLSGAQLRGTTTVGFFTPGCQPCEEKLPAFVEFAQVNIGNALAVIVANSSAEADPMVARTEKFADVVVEPYGGPVCSAFAITGTPVVMTLNERRVVQIGLPAKAA
ncbi:hypothetical protein AB0K21_14715 [Streptosporangium sp. NPDC049248]|uniref:hypothetical protein n=1 Tax=Streptosporangium sp. NPDC049248 TaxID=3155651 RepID=UPI003437B6EE